MSAIEGFKTEIVLDEIPPEIKVFLSTEFSFLVQRSRPTVMYNMLVSKELCWQLIDPFIKDTNLNIFARRQYKVWTNLGGISFRKT